MLPVARRLSHLLAGWWHGRCLGRGVVSTGPEAFRVGFLRLVGVLGIDAVGGPPHCDSADKGGARVASRCSPDWLGVTFAGVIVGLVGEVGDQLGSLCQIGPPDGMVMQRWWNVREPGQRTWVGRRELWEAPVEDGGHVAGGAEVSSGGGCQQVAERVFTGFGATPSRWARRVGQAGSVVSPGMYWSTWSSSARLGSNELFGCDVEAVGVALDGVEQPGRWVVELTQGAGGDGRSSRARICCRISVGCGR